jgi:hypothetical protein
MKVERFNLCILVSTIVVLASIILMATSGTQIQSRKPLSYKHPCIVLKVDNQGCQTEIEMRSRPATW